MADWTLRPSGRFANDSERAGRYELFSTQRRKEARRPQSVGAGGSLVAPGLSASAGIVSGIERDGEANGRRIREIVVGDRPWSGKL